MAGVKGGYVPVRLSVVMPLRNEEEILWDSIQRLAAKLDAEVGEGCWGLIPVDNGSTDNTEEIIKRIEEKWPLTRPIRLPNANIGAAMRVGLRAANAEWAMILPIDEVDFDFLRWAWRARDHYDLILGSKRLNPILNGQTLYRRFLSWGLNSLLSILTEYIGADTHGCKLVRLEPILAIDERCVVSRGQYDTELTIRAVRSGLRVAEVPVVYSEKRPARDLMLKKIGRNIVDIIRLSRALSTEPYQADVRFHRWCRWDIENLILPKIGPLSAEKKTPAESSPSVSYGFASNGRS